VAALTQRWSGRRSDHGASRSYAAATASTRASEHLGPITCMPSGSPSAHLIGYDFIHRMEQAVTCGFWCYNVLRTVTSGGR
jgi:hypothetical protein